MICSVVEPSGPYRAGSRLLPTSARRIVFHGAREVDRHAEAGQRLPVAAARFVAAPRLVQEKIEPVLVEDVDRIGAARHRQLAEAHAGRRHAMDPRVVEQPELVLREPIQIAPAEPRAVQVNLLKRVEIEITRQCSAWCISRTSWETSSPRQPPQVDRKPHGFQVARPNHVPFNSRLYPARRYSHAPPMPWVIVLDGTSKSSAVVRSFTYPSKREPDTAASPSGTASPASRG